MVTKSDHISVFLSFIVVLFLSYGTNSFGDEVIEAPLALQEELSPQQWFKRLDPQIWLNNPGILHSIHISVRQKNSLLVKKVDTLIEQLYGKSFIRFISKQDVDFVNRLGSVSGSKKWVMKENFVASFPVNLWLGLKADKISMLELRDLKAKRLGKWDYSDKIFSSPDEFLSWLRTVVGYDAVVIDVKDNYVLVGILSSKNYSDQALLIDHSAGKLLLNSKKQEAQAILQTIKIEGPFAIMERLVVADGSRPIEIGSKIILSQQKNPETSSEASSDVKAPSAPPDEQDKTLLPAK